MPRTNDATSTSSPKRDRTVVSRKAIGVLALVAVCIYALDQGAKFLVVSNLVIGQQVPVLGQLLQLHYVKNAGAAFSLGSGTTWIFAIIAAAVAIFILVFARRIRSTGWAVLFGLLLGGNVGNLTDRLAREPGFGVGHVVDFLQIYGFNAIFNVADMAIVFSMVIFVVLTVRGVRLDGTRAVKPVPTTTTSHEASESSTATSDATIEPNTHDTDARP